MCALRQLSWPRFGHAGHRRSHGERALVAALLVLATLSGIDRLAAQDAPWPNAVAERAIEGAETEAAEAAATATAAKAAEGAATDAGTAANAAEDAAARDWRATSGADSTETARDWRGTAVSGTPRRQIVVGLPTPQWNARGEFSPAPWVHVSGEPWQDATLPDWWQGYSPSPVPATNVSAKSPSQFVTELPPEAMVHDLPPTLDSAPPVDSGTELLIEDEVAAEPVFAEALTEKPGPEWDWRAWLLPQWHYDRGLGYDRLRWSSFEIEPAQPTRLNRLRLDWGNNVTSPDRVEYFWAKTPGGKGPRHPANLAETSVDYFDARFQLETGGEKMSIVTELPFRSLDPETRANTSGLGDMAIATKTVFKSNDFWTLTQVFRTYLNTGAASHGLGTGHVSLEPGFLLGCRLTDTTFLHSEVKYWIPLGSDPDYTGQIIRYGLGVSQIWRETDAFAMVPTLEVTGATVMDGQRTAALPNGLPLTIDIDGETIVNAHSGVWFFREPSVAGPPRYFDLGLSTGVNVSNHQLYEFLLRCDFRVSF